MQVSRERVGSRHAIRLCANGVAYRGQIGGNSRVVASLDRKRLGRGVLWKAKNYIRGVFDKETRRKPLAFAADALSYGI